MKPNPTALAVSLLSSALLLNAQAASAQANPPPATATRPAKNPPEQSSMPSNAPAGHNDPDHGGSQPRSR